MSIKVLADDTAIIRNAVRHLSKRNPEIGLAAEVAGFSQTAALTASTLLRTAPFFFSEYLQCGNQ